MNRIDQAFARLKTEGKTALMPFLTVGDPTPAMTVELILEMENNGADMIELGVPYSDPLADGPVIQRSSLRALEGQVTILDCIEVARNCRERGSKLPFIIFTYYNPALQLGLERFFELLVANDISGAVIPDVPVEENEELLALSKQHNIHLIPLVAPTSNERIRTIVAEASGFVYCVSSLGVTGVRSEFKSDIEDFIGAVKAATDVPAVIGFGISNRDHVERFSNICDGVIVGSAIVRKIEEVLPLLTSSESQAEGLQQVGAFIRELKG